ncbi:hypothetical protein Pcinc_009143 [Petrolisthes cinctipes]|uniref:THAP-type domain-containing protein n=1 Tax=Petrolisthes cinctipes TaxID=88211 RepID=A0AAE1G7Y3_PETCI|nr:hypothetical protein Pcinc_009143 [Petrolisthes cinctipes]
MVLSCCAVGCKNRAGKGSVSFYLFPANQEQREKWIAAVKRDGWQPTLYTRLCSDHFAKGHRDSNPFSPDFVPSIFHHTPSHKRHQRHQAMETFEKRQMIMRKRKRRGAVFLQTVSTAQLNTAEECNTSNTLAGGDAPQHPYVDSITGQSYVIPIGVAVSTVRDHVDTVHCENINIINGHSEK